MPTFEPHAAVAKVASVCENDEDMLRGGGGGEDDFEDVLNAGAAS